MREIKCRGKRSDNGGWAYGSLLLHTQSDHSALIFVRHPNDTVTDHLVDQETVGQFTGLRDRNGVEVFEGDIVKNYDGKVCQVEWKEPAWLYPFSYQDGMEYEFDADEVEVIGNIYENPELLKEAA